MSTVQAETIIKVSPRVAYDHWTRFEELANFLPGVDSITRTAQSTLHWVVSPGGVTREYDAEITEQIQDQLIAWESIDKPLNSGRVKFSPTDNGGTHMTVVFDWEPEGFAERAGAALMADSAFAKWDLAKFKAHLEDMYVDN